MFSWFQRQIIDTGRLPLFLSFLAFVVTFIATRGITRMIRAGRGPFKNNVSETGLHVHHAVPGVILLSIGAFMAVGTSETPWIEIAGVLVGVGISLVLDEFALILHLDDVYWGAEGRISVEMVSLAFACVGLFLLGINPFQIERNEAVPLWGQMLIIFVGVLIYLTSIVVCILKGKYRIALLGIFLPILTYVPAVRLARPRSRWAKRRYGPEKLERAVHRAAQFDARFGPILNRVGYFVAGKPTEAAPEPSHTLAP